MKQDWFSRLYGRELKSLNRKVKEIKVTIKNEKSDLTHERKRDYDIYHSCVTSAYENDLLNNRDAKITNDELSILLTLSKKLELSQEEVKLLNYLVIPIVKMDITQIINNLKNIGVIFFSKKLNTIYVADEMVRILRKIRGKDVADKFLRRTLRNFRIPEINIIARKHNIDNSLSVEGKIEEVLKEGVNLSTILSSSVHKEGTNLTDKKKYANNIWNKISNSNTILKGTTLDEKINNLINYFEIKEKDEKVGISIDGYEKLLQDLDNTLPKLNMQIRNAFELQEEFILNSSLLLDYNIKPRDILYLIKRKDLLDFCDENEIKKRGDEVLNILDNYRDTENLYFENFENIGFRNLNVLKENGIKIKESELGIKFEELTKDIFGKLGFNVDEQSRNKINTRKDKMDILINLGNNEYIIIECKTIKESGYNKFSAVSRQLKAYNELALTHGFEIRKMLLVAPGFSDDFIEDCELDSDLDLSLLTASSLITIFESFKRSNKHKQFPYKLLMRDVLINPDRIVKAISK
jgi:hypothetical protein